MNDHAGCQAMHVSDKQYLLDNYHLTGLTQELILYQYEAPITGGYCTIDYIGQQLALI